MHRISFNSLNSILIEYSISFHFFLGVAITQLGGITSALREKTRLTGSNAQNRKQYQEYQNTIASQNAGTPMKNMLLNCIKKPNKIPVDCNISLGK